MYHPLRTSRFHYTKDGPINLGKSWYSLHVVFCLHRYADKAKVCFDYKLYVSLKDMSCRWRCTNAFSLFSWIINSVDILFRLIDIYNEMNSYTILFIYLFIYNTMYHHRVFLYCCLYVLAIHIAEFKSWSSFGEMVCYFFPSDLHSIIKFKRHFHTCHI